MSSGKSKGFRIDNKKGDCSPDESSGVSISQLGVEEDCY